MRMMLLVKGEAELAELELRRRVPAVKVVSRTEMHTLDSLIEIVIPEYALGYIHDWYADVSLPLEQGVGYPLGTLLFFRYLEVKDDN